MMLLSLLKKQKKKNLKQFQKKRQRSTLYFQKAPNTERRNNDVNNELHENKVRQDEKNDGFNLI